MDLKAALADQSVQFAAYTTATGAAVTVTSATGGLSLWYRRGVTGAKTAINPSDLATLETAHAEGGILLIEGPEHRLDLPDAAVAAGVLTVSWGGTATGITIDGGTANLIGQANTATDVMHWGGTAVASAISATNLAKLEDILDGTGGTGLYLSTLVVTGAALGLDINGTTAAAKFSGGTTGIGLDINGGSSSGVGLAIDSTSGAAVDINAASGIGIDLDASGNGIDVTCTSDGIAMTLVSAGNKPALNLAPAGTGGGMVVTPGATAVGVLINGGATSGEAVKLLNTSGECVGITATSGSGVRVASVSGAGIYTSGTTYGLQVAASAGPAISGVSSGSNGDGMILTAHGTGADLNAANLTDKLPTNYIMGSSDQTDKDDDIDAILSRVNNLSTGSAAISTTAVAANGGFVITTGTSEANTEDSTHALDGTTHDLLPSGGTTDCYYIFNVGSTGVPTSVSWDGYVNTAGDSYTVWGYDWGDTEWVQIATLSASPGSTVGSQTFPMDNSMVGTGANSGLVHLRFYSTTGTKLATDRILCDYAVVAESVGYVDGSVWIDTNNGTAGTAKYINGTADNPVLTMADAYTIATAVGINAFRFLPGSSVQLTASAANGRYVGSATIDLNGQAIDNALFRDCYTVSGSPVGDDWRFENCGVGTGTLEHGYMEGCLTKGTYTLTAGDQYFIRDCTDAVADGTTTFVFAAAAELYVRNFRGGIQLDNMAAGDQAFIDGAGRLVIGATCSGGTITVRGPWSITDSVDGGFQGTLTDDARWNEDQRIANVTLVDTTTTNTDMVSEPLDAAGIRTAVGLASANIDTQLADLPTVAEFEARTIVSADYFVVGDYTAPLDAAGVRTAVGLASANLDTQLADLPTVAEFEARSIVSADYFVVGDYTAPLDAAGVRTAVGLASADLDTQLGTLSTHDADDVKTALGTGEWITTPVTTDAASRTASKADVSALATTTALATHDGKLDTADTAIDAILAMLDDARTEPGREAMPVNPDLATKIDYLYKALRNKKTQTATTWSLYNDAGDTVDQQATISDDATTATFGEVGAGA